MKDKKERELGKIHVYTGDGKGKTTSALGLALRAAGWGMRTYIAQFMKGQHYGELESVKLLEDFVVIEQFGSKRFIHIGKKLRKSDISMAQKGLRKSSQAIASGEFDIVVLDEINVAVKFGLVSEDEVLKIIEMARGKVELVLTGRYAPESFIQRADLVTEMKEIKHYYREGIEARNGIEK